MTAHSASVVSLEYRNPFRRYCARVISVHIVLSFVMLRNTDRITRD